MRTTSLFALFLGLLITADITYTCGSQALAALRKYDDLRVKELRLIEIERSRPLTPEEKQVREAARGELSRATKSVEDLQGGCYLGLGFAGCALVWLVVTGTTHAHRPGSILRAGTIGSLVGAVLCGAWLAGTLGIAFWFSEADRHRVYDRYEWEVRWLGGVVGGALAGAVLGAAGGALLKVLKRKPKPAA